MLFKRLSGADQAADIILCIDFLAVLGLPCCVDFSPVAAQGLLAVVVPPLV